MAPFARPRTALLTALILLGSLLMTIPYRERAQSGPGPFLPMGGGYSDLYAGFSAAALANAHDGVVTMLVLPMTYSTSAESITPGERETNLRDAEERRFQIEEACKRAAPDDVECRAILLPVFTRSDAEDPAALEPFEEAVSALFFLGGDQTVAMQVLAATPLEEALREAHAEGAVVAGTSAGAAIQSRVMLGGYEANAAAASSLNRGAVDLWMSDELRGLAFGIDGAIVDQHFFQRGRLGRLLNAIVSEGAPRIGIGVDAYTGVVVRESTVGETFGLYTVAILDAETYGAAETAAIHGAAETLGLRNVLVHLLAPGDFSYDLETRSHSLADPPARVDRSALDLRIPEGAGPLILAGDLSKSLADHPALARLREEAGEAGTLLAIGTGYPAARTALSAADRYAKAVGIDAHLAALPASATEPVTIPVDTTAILVVGRDQSLMNPELLAPVREAWLAGTPLLLDNAAAIAGEFFSAHGPTPEEPEPAEAATQKSLLLGRTELDAGLALLPVGVEPQLLDDNRWGRLISIGYAQPEAVVLGLSRGGALVLDEDGAMVLGAAPLVTLDLRAASLDLGENEGFVIANGLLDVFAPGETLAGEPARLPAMRPAPTPTPRQP